MVKIMGSIEFNGLLDALAGFGEIRRAAQKDCALVINLCTIKNLRFMVTSPETKENILEVSLMLDKDQAKTNQFKTATLKTELQALHASVVQWSQHARSVHAERNIAPAWEMKYSLPALGIS